jgi:predicted nucleic acid-binding Zn finger protein
MKGIRERIEGFLNRLERAEGILLEGRIHVVRGSESYLVDLQQESCTCPDHAKGHTCKHLLAAVLLERAERKAAGRELKEVA